MRLIIAGDYPLDLDKISNGAQAAIVNLTNHLQKIGDLEIHIITCKKEIAKKKIVSANHLKVHYLPSSRNFGNISLAVMDRKRIRREIEEIKPNLIHSQSLEKYSFVALHTKYPVVITIHGITHEIAKLKDSLLDRIRWVFVSYLFRGCLKKAKEIIVLNDYTRQLFAPLTNAHIHVIENPVSDRYFLTKNDEIFNRLLFAGRIVRIKNLLDLLKAINLIKKQIPRMELRIAGGQVEKDYLNMLREYVRKNRLEDNVKFLGSLSEEQIVEEYEKCCLFILPSLQETAPMVIQQAMAAGKPVIATCVGGIPNVVEDGRTGLLVDNGDIKGLADKIVYLLKNDNLRRSMGKQAREEALKRFKTEIIAQKVHEIYQEILK